MCSTSTIVINGVLGKSQMLRAPTRAVLVVPPGHHILLTRFFFHSVLVKKGVSATSLRHPPIP